MENTAPKLRKVRMMSVANLLKMKHTQLPFSGSWHDAFLQPAAYGTWIVYGHSGNGKTSFALQLVKYLDEEMGKRIAYLSLEEQTDLTMKEAAIRASWREKGSRIGILPLLYSPDEINDFLGKHKSPDVLIVDSVQYWVDLFKFNFEKYRELKANHPKKLIIYLSQAQMNEPKGALANKINHDASLKIFVQGYRAFSKGRSFGPVGYYSVWPEKEKEIWME